MKQEKEEKKRAKRKGYVKKVGGGIELKYKSLHITHDMNCYEP